MKIIATILFLLLSLIASAQQKSKIQPNPFSTKDKIVTVYTSVDSANLRLTKTGSLKFSELKQPLETQICIFVLS